MSTKLYGTRTGLLIAVVLIITALLTWRGLAKNLQAPTNLVAWDSGHYVQLNWDSNGGSYSIYRSVHGPDQWTLLQPRFTGTSFVDYDAPRSSLVYYRIRSTNVEDPDALNDSVVSINTASESAQNEAQILATYDKNNLITNAQLTNANTMNASQIQNFLTSQGSVLANFSSGGKTAAQRIYDDCQTHGINPQVVLVTLQKEKGLIRSASANPNSLAMGWNTGDSTTTNFDNQIYYGTRQFRLYVNNLAGYGWTVGQAHSVSDGTVTAGSIATAGLYIYTPWIGQGGGGAAGIGGNYLFWDLWTNTFGFGSSETVTSLGLQYPLNGGWSVTQDTDWNNGQGAYHLAEDASATPSTPVHAMANGTVKFAGTGVGGYGGVIVIEHNTGTEVVTSVYGHLSASLGLKVSTNQTVTQGQLIGNVAFDNEDGGSWGPHLHFGIRKGAYSTQQICGFWPYVGYSRSCSGMTHEQYKGMWHDPTDFINGQGTSCSNGSSTLKNSIGGPPIHPPGTVVKTASSQTVYLIDVDNKKRPITSAGVLAQLYNQSTDARSSTNFSNWVITIGQDELDLYEQGGNLSAAQPGNGKPFPDGKLIGFNGEVSIVTGGGKRRPFTDGTRFTGLGYSFCQVVNVTQTEYTSYPVGPPVDAMLMLVSSVNITPPAPYTVGQTINGSCGYRNVGYASMTLSNIGIGGRFNGSTIYDIGFVSRTLSPGESFTFGPTPRQLNNAGSYTFFAAYQENNTHWALSVPASSGVIRSRSITVNPVVTRTLTVSSTPSSSVSINVSPTDNTSQGSGTTQFTRTYNDGTSVTLTAPSTSGSNTFLKWQRNSVDWSQNASITVTMDANFTMTAVYSTPPTSRTINVNSTSPASGVNITVSPADNSGQSNGATPLTCTYNDGVIVNFTAPGTAGGNSFQKWQVDGVDWTFNTTATLTIDENHTMTAVYTPPVLTRTLTVSSTPVSGVPISVSPSDTNGLGNGSTQFTRLYNDSTSVSLSAPTTAGGNNFQKWQRDGVDWSTNTSITISVDADRVFTAVYGVGGPALTNFALPANGGSVVASSTLNNNFAASGVINGDRRGTNWESGGGWADANAGVFPDWVEVNFNGNKLISEIDVFTLQDNYTSPVEPTPTTTFNNYGLTAFDVQYWNGSNWQTVSGGSITGNNKVWRQVTFAPISTSRIRVLTMAAKDNGFSRITEVEAWGEPTGGPAQTNFALPANGGSIVASSTLNSSFPASSIINGDRRGTNWESGGGWADANAGVFPDWVEINFNGNKLISEIDVFTLQDSYTSPVEPTPTMTFNNYGLTAFEVQYWNGSNWLTVSGGSITGNNKVWRQVTFAPISTSRIRVLTMAAKDNGFSRITEVEAWGEPTGGPAQTNFALPANGGNVFASSTLNSSFPASGVINGDRRGTNWGSGGGWADANAGVFPDWVEINFNGNKSISEIDVFTLQDNYPNPVEPTQSMTFNTYGLTAFEVQYWNGSNWQTVPGGSITGNNKVWRQVTFTPISTSRIRVLTMAAADNGFSRITEVEAWGSVGP